MPAKKQAQKASEETAINPWANHSGSTGMENVTQQDLGIPFLTVLQDLSPQVKKQKEEYIPGAEPGMIINTLTKEILYTDGDQPLNIVPLSYERLYVEWKPRNAGGGIVKVHSNAAILSRTKRNDRNEDVIQLGEGQGNVIATTGYLQVAYGLENFDAKIGLDSLTIAVIAFKSTQLKAVQGMLNTARSIRINGRPVPLFSHSYELTTLSQSNDQGDWWGWKIKLGKMITSPDLATGVIQANQSVSSSENKALLPVADTQGSSAAAELVDDKEVF